MAEVSSGTSVDTSSYPKAALPVAQSPLDIASKLGNLQSQQLGISQQKLDQTNQALTYMTRAMGSVGPEGTKKQYFDVAQNAVNMGLVPQQMLNTYAQRLEAAPTPQAFYNEAMTAMATHKEQLDYQLGQQGSLNNGQTIQPTLSSPKPGFGGVRSSGMPIQVEPPPTAPVVNPETGQQGMFGGQNLPLAPGRVRSPGALPVGPIPGVQGQSNNFGGNVVGATAEAPTPAMTPKGPATAAPVMFNEGVKQYTEDQNLSTAKLTAIKPALQALPLLEGLTTGIGTDTYNKALAGLSNLGFLSPGMTDKVKVRQEVEKKLAQYVGSNPVGQRSDAAQTLAEAGSPSPKVQINPALIKLTKDAIILDRVQAARAGAFEGQDYSKYGQHRSTFPARVDERAFGLDLMDPKERNNLLEEMKKKRNTFEGKKFWNTLQMVDKQGLINTTGQ